MMKLNLSEYVGKHVIVKCKDGRVIEGHYVFGFTPHYENYDPEEGWPDEDSIALCPIKGEKNGIGLFESDIERCRRDL